MDQPKPGALKLRLSTMMFLQFFIWGCFFVPLGSYIGKLFAGREDIPAVTGFIYSSNNWAGLIAPLFVGLVADRFFNSEKINGLLHLIGAGVLYYCSTIGANENALFTGLLIYFCLYMPTLALVNNITFNSVENSERDFPPIRLWGTIGWIVAGLIVAQSLFGVWNFKILPDALQKAEETNFPLKLSAVASLIYGLYSFTLPATPPRAKGTKTSVAKMLGLDALKLFKDPSFSVFAVCSFLICIPLAFYYALANDFIKQAGFEGPTGIMALGQVSELVFMALIPFFFRKLGVKWMLLVGMLAWTLRYALFGMAFESHALLVLGVMLHGICYDFFFVTGQLYTDRKAPKEMRASAQSLIALLTYGGGMLVGNQVLGIWAKHVALKADTHEGWVAGAKNFWLLPSGIALVVAVIFAVGFWDKSADKEEVLPH
ncbi:MAG: nucleoside transporter [Akkermansiaceae bacterium]|nr:nucleoside transporter [Akkermansiaceae bacterium]